MSPDPITTKRSYSASPSPSPPVTPKKARSQSSANTPRKTPKKSVDPSTPSSTSTSGWTNEKKDVCIQSIWDTGYKNMDWKSLMNATGMTEEQLRNQLRPGRNNLRKTVMELFK